LIIYEFLKVYTRLGEKTCKMHVCKFCKTVFGRIGAWFHSVDA
jgi:hypothetical protein